MWKDFKLWTLCTVHEKRLQTVDVLNVITTIIIVHAERLHSNYGHYVSITSWNYCTCGKTSNCVHYVSITSWNYCTCGKTSNCVHYVSITSWNYCTWKKDFKLWTKCVIHLKTILYLERLQTVDILNVITTIIIVHAERLQTVDVICQSLLETTGHV